MFGLLIRKEILVNVLTCRFAVALMLPLLLLVSVNVMTNQYRVDRDNFQASVSSGKDHVTVLTGTRDPGKRLVKLSHEGLVSAIRPNILSILVSGLERELPIESHVRRWYARTNDRSEFENPFSKVLMAPDYFYVVAVILGLLALVFSFDSICGEKEQGTLKLKLSYAVPRHLILLAKCIGGYVVVIFPFLMAVTTALLCLHLKRDIDMTSREWIQVLFIIVASLVYISAFFTAGLLISTLTHKSATALIVSLVVWAACILVIPSLSIVSAKIIAPVPTYQKIMAEKRAIDKEIELKLRALRKTAAGRGGKGEHMEEELKQEQKRRKQGLDELYKTRLMSQMRLCQLLSRASPFASFNYVLADLADTGLERFSKVRAANRRFRQDFKDYFGRMREAYIHKRLKQDWLRPDELPTVIVFETPLERSLNLAAFDFLMLMLWNVICFFAAFMFFLRYDAR